MNKYIFKYDQVSSKQRIIIADNIIDAKDKFEKDKQHHSDVQLKIVERKITDIEEVEPKKKFNFRVDRLLSVWESQNVCVEADDLEEATSKLLEVETFDDLDSEILYETLYPIESGTKYKNTTDVYLENPETGSYTHLKNVKSL